MASTSEQRISQELRAALANLPIGAPVPESEELKRTLSELETFIPQVLQEIHSGWEGESLDGIYPFSTVKSGEAEFEIFGLCILITDQTLTPFQVRLQFSPSRDDIAWFECRLGEQGPQGMRRIPYLSLNAMYNRFYVSELTPDTIDWSYAVEFGEKHP